MAMIVPNAPRDTGVGASPLMQQNTEKVSPTNLLMAAATMHKMGRLVGKKEFGDIKKPRKAKVL